MAQVTQRRLVRIMRRQLRFIPVLLLVSIGTVLLTDLIPGDPAIAVLGDGATPAQIAVVRERLNADAPFYERYIDWASDAVRGELGESLANGKSVTSSIGQRLPVTMELAIFATVLALLLAVPTALYCAYRPGGVVDRVAVAVASASSSSPVFLTALLLVFFLSMTWSWFPVTGWARLSDGVGENVHHAFLPAFALAIYEAPVFLKVLRADLLATMHQDFIFMARASGTPEPLVVIRHAFRSSCFSLVTLGGVVLGRLMGGTIIVESIFALPGLGQLLVGAVRTLDVVLIQGIAITVAVTWVVMNMVVDVAYTLLDPRVSSDGPR